MPKTTSITCGNCGTDITTGGPYPSYRLYLDVEKMPNLSGFEYAVITDKPASPDWFCSVPCLIEKLS